MGKCLFAAMVILAFAAPTGLALDASQTNVRSAAVFEPGHIGAQAKLQGLDMRQVGGSSSPMGGTGASFWSGRAVRQGPLAQALAGIDHALESAKPQESALALLLDTDKSDEARDCEERLDRHRESALNRSIV